MTNLSDRFRSRLGPDWPGPLPDMLDAAVESDGHDPESVIAAAIGEWCKDAGLDEPLRDDLTIDALAFELSEEHGNDWGDTYFGPWMSSRAKDGTLLGSNPPLASITAEAINRWRKRAAQVDHPVAVARYSDLAWDLAPLCGQKRDPDDATRAIDAYLLQCVGAGSVIQIERCLARAHALARTIRDEARLDNVRVSAFNICRAEEGEDIERLRRLAFDLYVLEDDSGATDEQRVEALSWMETGLRRCADAGDPFDAEMFAERLDLHYRRGEQPERQIAARKYGAILEEWAAKGSALLALHNYKKAHGVYQAAGLNDEAKDVRRRIEESTKESEEDMHALSHTCEIPNEAMQGYVDGLVGYDWPKVLRRFVAEFLHCRPEFERQLDLWLEHSTMYGLLSQTVVTPSGDSVDLKSPAEDRESHVILKASEVMSFAGPFMGRVLDELVVRHAVTPDALMALVRAAPLFPPERHGLVAQALKAYFLHAYDAFIHLTLPQIEHALRLLMRHGAEKATTTSRDSKRWRQITLNMVLEDEAFEGVVGDEVALYLRIVLTHDLGLNMRNLVCHGLVATDWFKRARADRILHVLLMLVLLFERRQADSTECAVTGPGDDTSGGQPTEDLAPG